MQPVQAAPVSTPQPALETPRLNLELNPRLAVGVAVSAPKPQRFDLGQVDRAPLAKGQVPPPYPYLARRRGIEGAVTVRFLVDRHGEVHNLEVLSAKPSGIFEESVLKTVNRWRLRAGGQGRRGGGNLGGDHHSLQAGTMIRRTIIIALAVLLLAADLALAAPAQDCSEEPRLTHSVHRVLYEAQQLVDKKKDAEAAQKLAEYAKDHPDAHPRFWFLRGVAGLPGQAAR